MPSLIGRMSNLLSTKLQPIAKAGTRRQVAQYRKSDGRRGNTIMGKPVFLLDVVGRTSGELRPVMLMLARRGDDLIVVGSNAGNDQAPNWYRNLVAAGEADVQVGADRWKVTARELEDGPERDEAWKLANDVWPQFHDYQQFTDRRIPVALLERA